jgi:Sulfotransferase domain
MGQDAAPGRVPDFFVVGQPKSGTTALHSMLRRHPQIFMPESKEPWFFAQELQERTPPRPEGTPRTLEQYMALFAGASAEQLAGEATPLYLWSRTAAARIAEVRPDARIVAILREPASLLRSLHLQFLESYVETERDLAKALALEPQRRAGRKIPRYTYWPKALLYSEHVRYVEQLRRYEEHFPHERMLVLVYDDFRADNDATVQRVLDFLGVQVLSLGSIHANPTTAVRSQGLNELIHAVSVGRGPVSLALKGAVKAVTPQDLRRRALRATKQRVLYTEPEPADERLMAELRRRYAPEVAALSEHLGRDLVSLWGYDDL